MNDEEMKTVLIAFGGTFCQGWCGGTFSANELEVDHVEPKSKGGADEIWNRTLLCGPCNKKKSDKLTLPELRCRNLLERALRNLAKSS